MAPLRFLDRCTAGRERHGRVFKAHASHMAPVDAPLLLARAAPCVLVLGALSAWLFHTVFFLEDPPVEFNDTTALIMAAASTFFNALVVFYHLTVPPHPKFRLIRKRRLCLQTHVAAGCVEITMAVAALLDWKVFGEPASEVARHAAWAWKAGIVHSLTGLYQTQLVFGCKLVMRPAYYWCGLMHLMAALGTRADMTNPHRLLGQYLVLCIFTWCRVYIFILSQINFGMDAQYSLAISLAGITIFPHVLGPLGPFYFALFITASAFSWAWSANITFDSPEWSAITAERARKQIFDHNAMSAWKGLADDASEEESNAAALKAFKAIDSDEDGRLTLKELQDLVDRIDLHSTVRHAILESAERNEAGMDFKTFLNSVWHLGERSSNLARGSRLEKFITMDLTKITPIQKARAVFDAIDLDASGKVENFELKELLTWWGCPESELDSYMKGFDADGDGEISFDDEFYPEMQEIWRFGWDHVLLPEIMNLKREKHLHSVVEYQHFKERVSQGAKKGQ